MDCAKREGLEPTAPADTPASVSAGATDVFVILVTASRKATPARHRQTIAQHLLAATDKYNVALLPVVLRHGDAPGGDTIAADLAALWGWAIDPCPALWNYCGPACPNTMGHRRVRRDGTSYCPLAGPRRNEYMVDRSPHPNVVVGFPARNADQRRSGTWHCLNCAVIHGVPIASVTGLDVTPTPRRQPSLFP